MITGVSAPSFAVGPGGAAGVTGPTATPGTLAPRAEGLPNDFGAVLGQMALESINVIRAGEATAISGVRGQATTQQVVEAVMSAEETLQAGIAIRDKVVSAYLEVSRMAI